ncbi:MAG TPA: trypsin-like serine protease [Xanthobacteraceae bacterium]|nr:trypsin-like serine protease [Xanthobacteraceae bacterium]
MRRVLLSLVFAGAASLALAMVGGAPPASDAVARRVALIVGSRGNFCTGVALARDLVLTVAHCVTPGADYKLVEHDAKQQPVLRDVAKIARHPQFELKALLGHRATADVALLKLAQPADLAPARLMPSPEPVAVGDRFLVAGYGVAVRGDGRTGGQVRAATLSATGQPGGLQIRLLDPNAGSTGGFGACTGDSGAPVFTTSEPLTVIGLVSWSTGPGMTEGCGGLTGVTPLVRYRGWIVDQAAKLGSPLP